MEKARARETAKSLAFAKKGATQTLTKATSAIATLQAIVGRADIELVARPLVVLQQCLNLCSS